VRGADRRRNLGLYGKMASVSYEDYPDAKMIIVWGVNPSVSGIHIMPFIKEARDNGAFIVVIDPRATPLARQADVHLAVRPGTDLPVALSIHRYLFEEGHAAQAFLDEHTNGAAALREKASRGRSSAPRKSAASSRAAAQLASATPKTSRRS
jgi:anaerobic selenocysteine-containing dehydrogenase